MDSNDDVALDADLARRVGSCYVEKQPDENFPGSQDFPPPPFPAIRVATTTSTVTATTTVTATPVPWAEYDGLELAPMVSVAMTARAPRQPRRRASRSPRARSPDDDGPEPPPALAGKRYTLTCEAPACGVTFVSTRPHTRTCSHRCRQRLHVARADKQIAEQIAEWAACTWAGFTEDERRAFRQALRVTA